MVIEIDKTGNIAWSPACVGPEHFLAIGTTASQLDATFTVTSELDLYSIDFTKPGLGVSLAASIPTEQRFHKLAWGSQGISDGSKLRGLIAGGADQGHVLLYDASKLMKGKSDRSSHTLLLDSKKPSSAVKALDFNSCQPNCLASGATESEIFIWDLNSPGTSNTLCSPSQSVEDVSCLAWNPKVEHILASTYGTHCSVWDVRESKTISKVRDSSSHMRCKSVAWNPDEATQFCLASEDDRLPVIQLWDLRQAVSPVHTFEGHQRGILSMNWRTQSYPTNMLLSCGKDNRIIIWPSLSAMTIPCGEFFGTKLPVSNHWSFDSAWCPGNPEFFATASFSGRVSVHSLYGDRDLTVHTTDPTVGPESFAAAPIIDAELLKWSKDLEDALQSGKLAEFCSNKSITGGNQHEAWNFLAAKFSPFPRQQLLKLLGYETQESNATQSEPALEPTSNVLANETELAPSTTHQSVDDRISKALIVGSLAQVVDICFEEKRYTDAIVLSMTGPAELLNGTMDRYFRLTKRENVQPLIELVVSRNWQQFVQHSNLANWKTALAAVLSLADESEAAGLCETIGEHLESKFGARNEAALCYISAGNEEKLNCCWLETESEMVEVAKVLHRVKQHRDSRTTNVFSQALPTQPPAGLVTSGDGENVPTFQVEAAELVNQEQHQQTTQADSAHVVQQTQHDGHGSLQAVTTPDANSQKTLLNQPPAELVTSGDAENVPTSDVEGAQLVNQEQQLHDSLTTPVESANVTLHSHHDGQDGQEGVSIHDALSQISLTHPPAGFVTSGDAENVPTSDAEAAELVYQEQQQQTTQADSAYVVQHSQHDGHSSLQAVTAHDANSQTLLTQPPGFIVAPRPTEIGPFMEVVVSFITSPDSFYCQRSSTIPDLEQLQMRLRAAYEGGTQREYNNYRLKDLCIVQFKDVWCRAVVHFIDSNITKLRLIDYGDVVRLDSPQLKMIKCIDTEFASYPAFAFHCTLTNPGANPRVYSKAIKSNFAKEYLGKSFRAVIIGHTQRKYALSLMDSRYTPIITAPSDCTGCFPQAPEFLLGRPIDMAESPTSSSLVFWEDNLPTWNVSNYTEGALISNVTTVTCLSYKKALWVQFFPGYIKDMDSRLDQLDRHQLKRISHPQNGQLCVAVSPENGKLYRAVLHFKNVTKFLTIFVDFGYEHQLPLGNLYHIPKELVGFSALAQECLLDVDFNILNRLSSKEIASLFADHSYQAYFIRRQVGGKVVIRLDDGGIDLVDMLKGLYANHLSPPNKMLKGDQNGWRSRQDENSEDSMTGFDVLPTTPV